MRVCTAGSSTSPAPPGPAVCTGSLLISRPSGPPRSVVSAPGPLGPSHRNRPQAARPPPSAPRPDLGGPWRSKLSPQRINGPTEIEAAGNIKVLPERRKGAMSGHSKWSSIKHQKGVKDARRGKLFARLIRAIEVAARGGGASPESNPTLADAIQKAKDNSVPNDTIDRAVKRGAG